MAEAIPRDVPPFIRLADHPLRWRLMTELAASDLRVREVVDRLGQPQNLVSYHLRLLRDGGLVAARRSSHDGRDTYYHLDLDRCADGLGAAAAALHPALRTLVPPSTPRAAVSAGVLFVCTGNSSRSPIAEALLRHRTAGRIVVASAGISPRDRIHPHALRVLRERFGIDLGDQAPRSIPDLTASRGAVFDRVVTLCDRAREHLPARDGWRHTHWSLPDPAEAQERVRPASFQSIASEIDARVRHLIPTLEKARQSHE